MNFQLEQNPQITLNDGNTIPQLGLGVYKVGQDIGVELVKTALDLGYRRIDTASIYDNEIEVGGGIRQSGIAREEIFVTTKIWNDRQGYHDALEAIDEGLARLNIGYVDMLLIHWPVPRQNKFVDTWRAFEETVATGRVRSIGVSNFHPQHIEQLVEHAQILPSINQVEMHPALQQTEVRVANEKYGIKTEAWSPLGRGMFSENPVITEIAKNHGKTAAQTVLRWHIQLGNLVIPKSSNPVRLAENIDVFDFSLSADEMEQIKTLDSGHRIGPNPETFG
ncbi:MAG: hypothetical protein RI933_639 [Actinomycetota bacterium]|jgi:2,5-diketo-D-gluconate reductase A|uniref:Oxidoreductase n=1 Tax=Candidatus Rhodoluna planktonica TaxID=535712 RepID=A0A1D9DY66_9MICO|nr:aldo/keto reductase [Candidatus Rhodoluna planktonica]AOY55754.1 oxidoreductase [Candidatus Rhodoluna planktonica]